MERYIPSNQTLATSLAMVKNISSHKSSIIFQAGLARKLPDSDRKYWFDVQFSQSVNL